MDSKHVNIPPVVSDAQRRRLLDLRTRLQARDGDREILEIREQAGFVGITIRGGGLRRDGADTELLLLPDGSAHVAACAVPTGNPVAWESIEHDG